MICERVLFLGFAGVGDTLLVTPSLRLLRETFQDTCVACLLVSSGARDVLKNNSDAGEIIFIENLWKRPLRFIKTFLDIRKRNFDVVVTVYPTSRMLYNTLAFLSGAKRRVIHDYPADYFRKLSFLQNVRVPLIDGGHSVLQNMQLLEHLGVKGTLKGDLVFDLKEDYAVSAERFLSRNGFNEEDFVVGVHSGSGGMEYKRWPLSNFLSLAGRLSDELGAKMIFFCGPNESELAERVRDRGFIVFDGSSLGETAALISKCNLFVSNDSGLMHVAVSQNVPVVAIFGPTDPAKTGPYTTKKKEVVSKLSCSPCYDPAAHRKFSCIYGESRCLEAVGVEEVFDAVKSMIKESRTNSQSK